MKKLFLSIPLLLLALPSMTTAETYTSELQKAYAYSFAIGITTQSPIDNANMYGTLIRSHMAKMMVNYAKEVLDIPIDTSLECNFTDVAKESAELKGYIIQACQMGLMGVNITAFGPNDLVTRAQFGTVLSRALYGDSYNYGDPYYADHLQALKEAKIMNNISTPSASEVRGYVMLMMMRAGGATEGGTSPCDTPENQLLCMIDSPNCPFECQDAGIISFAGNVQVSTTSIEVGNLPAGTKYLGSFQLTADEDIILKTLQFQKNGSFAKARIEDDGVRISTMQNPAIDTSMSAIFSPDVIIKKGTSKILSVFIESDSSSSQGVTLSSRQNIQSSASGVAGSFPQTIAN